MSWLSRASRQAVRRIQPLVPRQSGGVTILSYHLVGAGTQSVVDLPIDVFRAQLDELCEFAQVISLADAVDRLKAGTGCAKPAVVITFDDGFDNFRTRAWPLLKQRDLPCTLYVPVGFVEGTSGSPLTGAEGLKPLPISALRELASERLLTIGSHSWCHRDLRRLGVDELRRDLRRSRDYLQNLTEAPVKDFCYPQAKWSRAVAQEVDTVYSTAVVAGGRGNFGNSFNPRRLWRTPVRRDMPSRLAPVVQSAVWLEEWAASHARTLR